MSVLTETPANPRELLRKAGLVPKYLREAQGTPWDRAPRRRDLRDPAGYWQGMTLHERLLRDDHTMISSRRGRALFRLAQQVERDNVPGALVDCGVWNGGSTILLANGAPTREAWAFDSFEGLPEAGPLDGDEAQDWTGECLGAEDKLRAGFAKYADPSKLHVVKGWFEDTFPSAAPQVGPVAVLHADGDWYDSVLLTLRTFYDQLSPGGYVAIDDYGHWIGARRAVDEFRAEIGETSPLVAVDYSGRYWRKTR